MTSTTTSTTLHHVSGDTNISRPLESTSRDSAIDTSTNEYTTNDPNALDSSFYASGFRSLSGIALHAFSIGIALGISVILTTYLLLSVSRFYPLWRLPAFLTALSTFHFLEFYTTARYNPTQAKVSSFLLFSNGMAYNIAHGCATLEIIISSLLRTRHTTTSESPSALWWRLAGPPWVRVLGLALVVVGQLVRSAAMAQAGTNFNHIPARRKEHGHRLVTEGVYAWLRHPSYFGFFWWAIGTQLMVGNVLCTLAYTVVLWRFFDRRIRHEEGFLVQFFGDEYVGYRARVGTKIPGIA